jgi:hypothetical protein
MDEHDRQLTTRDLAQGNRSNAAGDDTRAPEEEPLTRDRSEHDGSGLAPDRAERSEPAEIRPGAEFGPLLPGDQTDQLMLRWQDIQSSFVDKPRDSVEQADALVADLMQRLAASFSRERERLETQWDRGDDVSTEDLRVALTRYRSFFDRLLSV